MTPFDNDNELINDLDNLPINYLRVLLAWEALEHANGTAEEGIIAGFRLV